jgi:hypothetical protein
MFGLFYAITAVHVLANRPGALSARRMPEPSSHSAEDALAGASILARDLTANWGHAFVVGAARTGKTVLIEKLFNQLSECVVYLKVGPKALPGWEDAPFYGTFHPADGSAPYGEDLDDILRQRPAGRFQLDFPMTALRGSESVAAALKQGLAQSLIKSATDDHASHLRILVDDIEQLVDELAMLELMTKSSCTWTLIASRQDVKASEYQHAAYCRHVIGMRISADAALVTEDTLGIPAGTLSTIPRGSFWYSTQKGRPGQLFKFYDERPTVL